MSSSRRISGCISRRAATSSGCWNTNTLLRESSLRLCISGGVQPIRYAAMGANGIVVTSVDDSVWEGQKMQATAIFVAAGK